MIGRTFGYSGFYQGGINPFVTPIMNYSLYSSQVSSTRLLYHSGIPLAVPYPLLPKKTLNFSRDLLPRRDYNIEKTLTSKKLSLWDAQVEDIIITEEWSADGGLSFPWEFFHDLHRIYTTPVDWLNGEYMVWRPLDRTDKVFPVQLYNIEVDGEDFDVRWTGLPPSMGFGVLGPIDPTKVSDGQHGRDIFSPTTLKMQFLLRPEAPPGLTLYVTEGSDVDEVTAFEQE